jgi:uncharacterized protein YdhG (YjbR/CyaY superfamily)
MAAPTKPTTVDAYIAALPVEHRGVAEQVRQTIRAAAPAATERISYGMPAFRQDGRNFFYFGVWKEHIGVYPIYPGPPEFEAGIAEYRHGKDTVRFLLRDPVPHALLTELVRMMAARKRG